MTKPQKFSVIGVFCLFMTACSSAGSTANPASHTPMIVYITATPQVITATSIPISITETPAPTLPPPTGTETLPPPTQISEPVGLNISLVNSGQLLGNAQSWDIAMGDLDGDGDLDAFVANALEDDGSNTIWFNEGDGTFIKGDHAPGFGQGLALGDLDGDGDLDAVVTDWAWGKHGSAWFNDGVGYFAESDQTLDSAFQPALGDLDGDGDLDLFFARMASNSVWLNDGAGFFTNTRQRLGSGISAAVSLGDLDGDGDLDALVGGWEEAAKVWLNDSTGLFTQHELTLSPASVHIHDLALGDLDNDGDLDAFMAVASREPNQVWFNDGQGAFRLRDQPLNSPLAHGLSLGDLDGDGDLDALTVHGDPWSKLYGGRIWVNDGVGNFKESSLHLGEEYSAGAALGDLDGDGDLDAFISHGDISIGSGGGIPNTVWINETVDSANQSPLLDSDAAMVRVPGGTFQMGSTDSEVASALDLCHQHYSVCNRWFYERENPQHTVTLDEYWISETEVTNAQYKRCVDSGTCPEPTTCKKGESTFNDPSTDDHPVVCVSWEEAESYCSWIGGRLPTEAEWEYAFRGEAGSIFPWGDEFDGSKLNYCDINCSQSHADIRYDDGYEKTAPAGSFPMGTAWSGLFNMGGNVSEWVSDWLGDYVSEPLNNPSGPVTGTEKVVKGCSWYFNPAYCRGGFRASVHPDTRFDYLGFRCASSTNLGPEGGIAVIDHPIEIPSGNPPNIDGTMLTGEWDGAALESFADGSELLLKHDGEYIYLGIRSIDPGMIAANVFLLSGGTISVLHTSAALGTAIFESNGEEWRKAQDFKWRCRSTSDNESAREERDQFLLDEGWEGANGRMGTPNELEYKIKIPEGGFRMAAVYLKTTYPYEKVPWPGTLTDACIEPTPGGFPETLAFSPEQWVSALLLPAD